MEKIITLDEDMLLTVKKLGLEYNMNTIDVVKMLGFDDYIIKRKET